MKMGMPGRQLAATLFSLLILLPYMGFGQPNEEELGFIDSIAALAYSSAWPTATYREWSYRALNPVNEGHDLLIRLSGDSAFGGDLWIDLSFQFRNGVLADVAINQHNAILMPPFETSRNIGALALELAREYSGEPVETTSGQDVAAVCVVNALGRVVNLEYRWGSDAWQKLEIQEGYEHYFWRPYPADTRSSPDFQISMDVDFTDKDLFQIYTLKRYATTTPVDCEKAYTYELEFQQENLVGIYDREG